MGIAWVDYKKAYDMVFHSGILETLELVQVFGNIFEFVKRSNTNWQTELTSCEEGLAKVNITRGVFLFPPCHKASYTLLGGDKIKHPLFMDDLKWYGKRESEFKGLLSTVEVFSQDTGLEFSIKKCGVIIMNRAKVKSVEKVELPSGEKIRETRRWI